MCDKVKHLASPFFLGVANLKDYVPDCNLLQYAADLMIYLHAGCNRIEKTLDCYTGLTQTFFSSTQRKRG